MRADVLIAGGGVAGSSLAILLGRQGLAVALYERSLFPREKPCGEGLLPAGVGVLQRLGLAGEAAGQPFVGVRYHSGRESVDGRFPKTKGLPDYGVGQRRLLLDQLLFAAAARTPGVQAHAGTAVSAALVEGGRVTGLVVEARAVRAGLVVAADGSNSRLRHQLGLDRPPAGKRFGVRAHFRLGPRAEASEWVEVFMGVGYELYVTPLPARETLVAALSGAGSLDRPIEQQFLEWCHENPRLAERLRGAEQITQFLSARLGTRARGGVAPGIVLLGDAAGSPDPITGSGMTQALLSAELLAAELMAGLPLDEARLGRFERRRRAMFRDAQRLTRIVLALAQRPGLARLAFRLLRKQPEIFSHLLGVSGSARQLFECAGSAQLNAPDQAPGTTRPTHIPRVWGQTP